MIDEMIMYQELFGNFCEDKENAKVQAFDKLAKLYYNKNFGAIKKSDIDLAMFAIFVDRIIEINATQEFDELRYSMNDVTISQELGITPSAVRNLKEKKNIKYPNKKYDWKSVFKEKIKHARVDEKNNEVVINIPDKTVLQELENFIVQNNGYVEKQLSPNLVKIPTEYFIMTIIEVTDDENKEKLKLKLQELEKERIEQLMNLQQDTDGDEQETKNAIQEPKTSWHITKMLLSGGVELGLTLLKNYVPFGGLAEPAVRKITELAIKQFEDTQENTQLLLSAEEDELHDNKTKIDKNV